MKTRATLAAAALTLAASATLLPAQIFPEYDDVRLNNMPYTNTGGENGLTYFYYGRDGRLRSAVWTLADSSRHSCNYLLYDGAGCAVEKYREFSDGLTSTEAYENDAAGRRVSETFDRSDGVHGTARFYHDRDGRLTAAVCDNFKGWFTGKIVYAYDTAGRRSGADIRRDGNTIGTIEYAYDGAGHLAQETWDFGGRWSQTFTYEYEPRPGVRYAFSSPYVAMNAAYRVAGEDYDFNNEKGGPSHYTYDAAGRLTERTCRRSDGEEGRERYAYDRLGRLEGAEYDNMDFWLNGVITFCYDGWGHIAAGTFEGRDGFDADITFETDAHGNVERMHWVFSFGKTQTYRFRYAPAGG